MANKLLLLVAAALAALLPLPTAGRSLKFQFTDFSTGQRALNPTLSMQGYARYSTTDSNLWLVANDVNLIGSFFTKSYVNVTETPCFSASFSFFFGQCASNDRTTCGSGYTFVMQNSASSYIGAVGDSNMGLFKNAAKLPFNFMAIGHKMGTEKWVAAYTEARPSGTTPVTNASATFPSNMGTSEKVTISYDCTRGVLTATAKISNTVAIATASNLFWNTTNGASPKYYVGFTAGTGGQRVETRLQSASFTSCTAAEFVNNACVPADGCLALDPTVPDSACLQCFGSFFGPNCTSCAQCIHGTCVTGLSGSCQCSTGWQGASCTDCAPGYYGPSCTPCANCVFGVCNQGVAGNCACSPGRAGSYCMYCAPGYCGASCTPCSQLNATLPSAGSVAFSFANFMPTQLAANPPLSLQGSASVEGSTSSLVMTAAVASASSSVFAQSAINVLEAPCFNAHVRYTVTSCSGGSCNTFLTLTLQNSGPSYVGGIGFDMGLLNGGRPVPLHFIAMAHAVLYPDNTMFRTYTDVRPNFNYPLTDQSTGLGTSFDLWFAYDGVNGKLYWYRSQPTPATPTLPYAMATNVFWNTTGSPLYYIGFTGSTASDYYARLAIQSASFISCRADQFVNNTCIPADGCLARASSQAACLQCSSGRYGPNCTACTDCAHGDCTEGALGSCQCHTGWAGSRCSECAPGYAGASCASVQCPTTCVNGLCNQTTSTCDCNNGATGAACEECQPGFYGPTCTSCALCIHGVCSSGISGTCTCSPGWAGATCSTCAPGYVGASCLPCPTCGVNGLCNTTTGGCDCNAGWTGATCATCAPGYFGAACTACSECAHGDCASGTCTCNAGWAGATCSECAVGFEGGNCSAATETQQTTQDAATVSTAGIAVGVVVGVVVAAAAVLAAVIIVRRQRGTPSKGDVPMPSPMNAAAPTAEPQRWTVSALAPSGSEDDIGSATSGQWHPLHVRVGGTTTMEPLDV